MSRAFEILTQMAQAEQQAKRFEKTENWEAAWATAEEAVKWRALLKEWWTLDYKETTAALKEFPAHAEKHTLPRIDDRGITFSLTVTQQNARTSWHPTAKEKQMAKVFSRLMGAKKDE